MISVMKVCKTIVNPVHKTILRTLKDTRIQLILVVIIRYNNILV